MGDSIPGFRFYPTEEELISFYLQNKLEGIREEVMDLVIPVLNIYDFTPSQLPQYAGVKCRGDPEQCFFFIPRQESEARGGRPSRLTETGYWKATGSPSYVYSSNNRVIGLKRTMVFYVGRAPQGEKTQWKMNEYKAIQLGGDQASSSTSATTTPTLRQEFSLCRVYKKTKCLRAFDRRPTGVEIITSDINIPTINFDHQQTIINHDQGGENHHHHHHHHHHNQYREVEASMLSTTHDHQPRASPLAAVERTSSQDGSTSTSSPGDHRDGRGGPSQMVTDEEAFDWIESLENSLNFFS